MLRFLETGHSGYRESIFPKISFDQILDIQFQLAYGFHCSPFDFDNCELFEFLTFFDKLAKQKEREAKSKEGNTSTALESILGGGG